MLLKRIYLIVYFVYFIIYLIDKALSYDLVINNDEEVLFDLAENVNILLRSYNVQILLIDDYYKLPQHGRNLFNIQNNLTFHSENGTIFDFQSTETTNLYLNIIAGAVDKKITFRNITFYNYDGFTTELSAATHFTTTDKTNRYTVEFDNCTFKNNKKITFYTHVSLKLEFGNVTFDHCNFTNIYGDSEYGGSIVYSDKNYGNKLVFVDSIFNNNIVNYNIPLFNLYESSLSIINTKFLNCLSYYGYIVSFRTLSNSSYSQFKVTIEDSEFSNINSLMEGKNNIISIKNTKFSNITSISSIPVIMNALYSNVSIVDSVFSNIVSHKSSLFMDQGKLIFMNTTFSDIITNSKTMINFMYNSVIIEDCEFKNILCNGDSDNSSLIIFDSGENSNTFDIKNVIIENCKTNGDMITINGNKPIIKMFNVKIDKIHSYGALINNQSIDANISIDSSVITNNENINKWKCGLITNYNSTFFNVENSIFKNNNVKNNGGSLCFMNYNKLSININTTVFENNSALNGGVIYFNEKVRDVNINDKYSLKLENIIFKSNNANYFGGAIYSDFNISYLELSTLKNVSFIDNHAYAGGAIYISNADNTHFNLNNKSLIEYKNNVAISHGNNFATSPYYVKYINENNKKFDIMSGMTFPFEFILYDKFNQTVTDLYKYYSNIALNIKSVSSNCKIHGNICNFSKGQCELNHFKIYTTNPTTVDFQLALLENNDFNVKFDLENISFKINDCKSGQIKIVGKNGFYQCEDPICNSNCPVSSGRALCLKSSNITNINNVLYNKCQCVNGWKGKDCHVMDYSPLKFKYNTIITTPIILIILSVMIFNYLNRHVKIIEDTGYIKLQMVLFGLLLFYISCNFNVFHSFFSCSLNILLRHCGVLLIYILSLIYTLTGCELGVRKGELQLYLNVKSYERHNNIELFYEQNPIASTILNEKMLLNIENELNQIQNKNQENKSSIHQFPKKKYNLSKYSLFKKKTEDNNDIKSLNKLVSNIHSLFTELIILYTLFLLVIAGSIIYYKTKDDIYVQEYDGKWIYKCPLQELNFIFNCSEFIIIIYLTAKVTKVWNYVYIFKCLKNILYISIIWLSFGPLINIITYLSFMNNNNLYNICNSIINELCYFIILILYTYEKIYYIISKKGNDFKYYFNSVSIEKCLEHNSYSCGCNKEANGEEEIVNNYLSFYKFCSKFIQFSDGKFKYVRKNSKNTMKFII
ncbi:hypothetical protein BCR36DRAFT_364685 [Piromyces finnis]|uniref:EGF-like domain-containing protein n=1 Tax=Piromyces finnis TaxID=1754191 RepID=A0A1Y1UQR6_9FUNG|nr:hypothetical protein BCR36DRAFT_364685 [Piromyces finnis]|eukprot:ORX40393.1 hypothetical protein BCR36DRAFT_364685 [Piromyces finnis]